MSLHHPHPDTIADCILDAFNALPQKFKPRTLNDGRKEWVPLAGIVVCKGEPFQQAVGADEEGSPSNVRTPDDSLATTFEDIPRTIREATHTIPLTCAALATGMKCLPQAKVPQAQGNVLHDWHAEVLAIRGFNRWLLDECAQLAEAGKQSRGLWVAWRHEQEGGDAAREELPRHEHERNMTSRAQPPFKLQDDVSIHMYVSQAPCGDASMELTMAAQDSDTAWTHAAPSAPPDAMIGRGHFDQLGVVRRKPSRPDAPMTISKSCSDKLAMKQVTGLLSGITAGLVWPGNIYLNTLVLPEKELVPKAIERSFGRTGRMKDLVGLEERQGYAFRPFEVKTTRRTFHYAKTGKGAVGSNLSALYTPRKQEVLINGALQGRKQFNPRGASCVSRRGMWSLALRVALATGSHKLLKMLLADSYGGVKTALGHDREGVKVEAGEKALQGWRKNKGDEDWSLDSHEP